MKRSRMDDLRIMGRLLPDAERLALEMGEEKPGAEHLILAALELGDGSARTAFARVGADPDGFRAAIEEQHAAALRAVGAEPVDVGGIPLVGKRRGPLKATASAQGLFQEVVKRVRKQKSQLYGAWFLLVAAESEHGTPARVFRHMGVDRGALASAALAEIQARG